jgi:hypothetical protein
MGLYMCGKETGLMRAEVAHHKRLIKKYSTKERLCQKPRAEELVHEIELSRDFIQEVKGQFGKEIEEKIDLLERVIAPQGNEAKPVSFIGLDARHGRKSPKRMFSGYKAHIVEDESEIVTSALTFCKVIRTRGANFLHFWKKRRRRI